MSDIETTIQTMSAGFRGVCGVCTQGAGADSRIALGGDNDKRYGTEFERFADTSGIELIHTPYRHTSPMRFANDSLAVCGGSVSITCWCWVCVN